VNPVKLYVGVIFDLLWDDAKLARAVIAEYRPQVAKGEYMIHWKSILEG